MWPRRAGNCTEPPCQGLLKSATAALPKKTWAQTAIPRGKKPRCELAFAALTHDPAPLATTRPSRLGAEPVLNLPDQHGSLLHVTAHLSPLPHSLIFRAHPLSPALASRWYRAPGLTTGLVRCTPHLLTSYTRYRRNAARIIGAASPKSIAHTPLWRPGSQRTPSPARDAEDLCPRDGDTCGAASIPNPRFAPIVQ